MAASPKNASTVSERDDAILIRRFVVSVVEGPDTGARAVSESDELTIGSARGTSLQINDPAVSRHHCAIRVRERGLELRDLGSTNGTFLADTEIVHAFVRDGARVRIGGTTLLVTILDENIEQPLASGNRFGALRGGSTTMRRLYSMIEQCARSDATILIHGETGTGKELVAAAVHEASRRRDKPFIIIDCSALPTGLAEAELFGHVRGAFTGADKDRAGAFEQAAGGTVFLDEIGELPLTLQPILLRVLDTKTVRRIGTNENRPVDVRVVAATNRDLRVEVNARRFRSDLFFRLNVLGLSVPPLRERPDDVALLAAHFWTMARPDQAIPEDLVNELMQQSWPGNVRELRNAVEVAALVGWNRTEEGPTSLSYGVVKDRAIQAWERPWVMRLLVAHGHNVSRAARAAKMARSHLRELVDRYELREPDGDDE